MKKLLRGAIQSLYSLLLCAGLVACLGIPKDAKPIEGFELERYLGTWFEIARMDHSFERGMTHVSAQYSLRDGGGIKVINRGFKTSDNSWSEAEGRAFFIGDSDIGQLKVSFFGPFYGAYNIIELDQENYQYALIVGANTSYMWILARRPELDPAIVTRLVAKARSLGFKADELIFPEHDIQ